MGPHVKPMLAQRFADLAYSAPPAVAKVFTEAIFQLNRMPKKDMFMALSALTHIWYHEARASESPAKQGLYC